jgi:hypothetical protein
VAGEQIIPVPIQTSLPITPTPSFTSLPDQVALPHLQKKMTVTQIWKEALLPYLGTRLVIFVVGLFATYYILPEVTSASLRTDQLARLTFPQSLWLMWARFDSGFYIPLAQSGYWSARTLHQSTNWAFYPLYPLVISGTAKLLGGSTSAYYIAGVLISNLAGIVMVAYLYALTCRERNRKIAARTVLYLAIFPTAFFFSAIFTESLFLCLSIACIYYARRQAWWLAGLCGGLAALTRSPGITLVVPLAWEYLRVVSTRYAPLPAERPASLDKRARLYLGHFFRGLALAAHEKKNWLNGLAPGLVPCGLLAFLVYGQIKVNDFFAPFHASAWGWRRPLSPPWRLLIYSLRHPILGQPMNWNFWVFNIIVAFAGLAVIIWAWRRLPMIYTLYTAAMVLLPLSSSLLNSFGRYALTAFPAFILLATFTSKADGAEERLHHFITVGFAALEAVFTIFFVLGFPLIA